MGAKKAVVLSLKIIILTVLMVAGFIIASIVCGVSSPPAEGEVSSQADEAVMPKLVIISFLWSVFLSYIILRSRWSGFKLAAAVFLAFYGLMTVLPQMETVIFLTDKLPKEMVPKFFGMGAVIAAVFTFPAVFILGKMGKKPQPDSFDFRAVMPAGQWAWRLPVIAVSYIVLYLLFGYFVAWKQPAVRQYYGGTDPGSFLRQLAVILNEGPWFFGFQFFRGLLFAGFGLPVIIALKGRRREIALATAFLFSIWSLALLLPNPYMPADVAMIHLIETTSSNFLFGLLTGWLLSRPRRECELGTKSA